MELFLEQMCVGEEIVCKGEKYFRLQSIGKGCYLAVKKGEDFPAQVVLIKPDEVDKDRNEG